VDSCTPLIDSNYGPGDHDHEARDWAWVLTPVCLTVPWPPSRSRRDEAIFSQARRAAAIFWLRCGFITVSPRPTYSVTHARTPRGWPPRRHRSCRFRGGIYPIPSASSAPAKPQGSRALPESQTIYSLRPTNSEWWWARGS
jgi:hypothetical protein